MRVGDVVTPYKKMYDKFKPRRLEYGKKYIVTEFARTEIEDRKYGLQGVRLRYLNGQPVGEYYVNNKNVGYPYPMTMFYIVEQRGKPVSEIEYLDRIQKNFKDDEVKPRYSVAQIRNLMDTINNTNVDEVINIDEVIEEIMGTEE
jgi:hypothetical protein